MTLADETVSRWHASLERNAGGWLLADLGSTNGTRLNGWRVNRPMPVRSGDMVSFGGATFVLSERPLGGAWQAVRFAAGNWDRRRPGAGREC